MPPSCMIATQPRQALERVLKMVAQPFRLRVQAPSRCVWGGKRRRDAARIRRRGRLRHIFKNTLLQNSTSQTDKYANAIPSDIKRRRNLPTQFSGCHKRSDGVHGSSFARFGPPEGRAMNAVTALVATRK